MSEPSEESLELAAQCWCDKETSTLLMDARLAAAFAKRLDEKNKRIAELEKERDAILQEAKIQACELDTKKGIVRGLCDVFGLRVHDYHCISKVKQALKAHNLEQQAKGVELFVKSEAESLQGSNWFKDSKPTLEYLYDADFGLSTCSSAVRFSENLRDQAKALKEQGE